MDVKDLNEYVIMLHNIAREVQKVLGSETELVKSIRKNGDDLTEVINVLSRL